MDMWNYGRPSLKPSLECYNIPHSQSYGEPHLTPYPEGMLPEGVLTPRRGAAALMELYQQPHRTRLATEGQEYYKQEQAAKPKRSILQARLEAAEHERNA